MTKKDNNKFLLIDAHAIIHRAYHAFPPTISTRDGKQVNAVYGFTSILLGVLRKFDPEYVVCAFDSKGPTVRHDKYEEYKATRKKPDDEMLEQIPIIHKVVKAFNIPIFIKEGFEADDILGTLVNLEEAENLHKIIVTGDQDIFQLVNNGTKVFLSGTKFSKSKLYGWNEVKEKFGFGPDYILDYKALKGDPSDNIPGIKGIGDVTAKKLISNFGHLEEIYQNIDDVSSKSVKNKLMKDKEISFLSKDLATIIEDVPLKFNLEDAKLKNFNPEGIKRIFVELEFKSLMNKIPSSKNQLKIEGKEDKPTDNRIQPTLIQMDSSKNKKEETGGDNSKLKYEILNSESKINVFMAKLAKHTVFAFDTETTGLDFMNTELLGISFSWEAGQAYYIDFKTAGDLNKKVVAELRTIFEDPEVKKIGHNLKYDAHVIRNKTIKGQNLGFKLQNYYFDTLVAAYILSGGRRNLGLKTLAFAELGMQLANLQDVWKSISGFKKKKNYSEEEVRGYMLESDPALLGQYACADADATWQLYEKQFERFESKLTSLKKDTNLKELFFDIEMPLVEILLEMEREGIDLDQEYLKKYGKSLDKKIREVEDKIFNRVGQKFNLASPKQLGEILFDVLKLEGGKKTKTGAWQTNERVLLDLKDKSDIIPDILDHREYSKLRSTYINSLIEEIDQNTGKIHTSYNQTIATTGRLTSSNPNLQNIPVSSDLGMKIRKAFIAGRGKRLVSFDISQQELRILAHMSEEKRLIDAFNNGVDVHALTASNIFDVDIEEVTKEQRDRGKTLNFSLMYGITEFGLANRLKIEREEARSLIDNYFMIYPRVKIFFEKLLRTAEKEGVVETMFGRFRDAKGLSHSNGRIRSATRREVINFPIQGTAADMIKISMKNCFDFINKDTNAQRLKSKMLLQVHDELIFRIDYKRGKKYQKLIDKFKDDIKEIMENAVELKVPVAVSINMGTNWAKLK
ncbi:DNA polymerase I [Candidatus Dojkabacteria bacterium]|nr:DNA polymerase I [Candidatus Dojkabacteria bacterium]